MIMVIDPIGVNDFTDKIFMICYYIMLYGIYFYLM